MMLSTRCTRLGSERVAKMYRRGPCLHLIVEVRLMMDGITNAGTSPDLCEGPSNSRHSIGTSEATVYRIFCTAPNSTVPGRLYAEMHGLLVFLNRSSTSVAPRKRQWDGKSQLQLARQGFGSSYSQASHTVHGKREDERHSPEETRL